ncbi:cytidylate kinase-like family protein [Clostridium sp. chh4-2]|uniref:cytidylate kinase-like family protein n=1 Tax=Clostridium sp. chh4-2 TaxID=2067550 RepID=UPI0015E16021|nr:cytidylate kinase-like family protein [Clostridium sp. chh4-2]
MIITIGREYGSGGHDIGVMLSNKLGIKLYDKERLKEEAKLAGIYEEVQLFYEEEPVNSLLYAIAQNNCAAGIGRIPFHHIHEIAHREPCIIIGRCANHILKDDPELVSIFIHAEMDKRIEKIAHDNKVRPEQAKKMIAKEDKRRENFFYYYTGTHWRDVGNYHLCIDRGRLGMDGSVELIQEYISKLGIS